MLVSLHLKTEFIIIIIFVLVIFLQEYIVDTSNIIERFITSFSQFCLIIFGSLKQFKTKEEENKEKKFGLVGLIYLLSTIILNFIVFYLTNILDEKELYGLDLFLPIICFFILEKIVFKQKIYSHHILSMIINFFIILFLIYLLNSENTKLSIFIYAFFLSYVYAFYTLLIKFFNVYYNINIYFIASLIGLIEMIYHIGFINKVMKEFKEIKLLSFLLLTVINFVYHFLYYFIIWKLGPIHSSISECIAYVIIFFFDFELSDFLFFLPWMLLSIFSAFIYLNIIELKFCGLNKYHMILRKEKKRKIEGQNLKIYHEFNEKGN